MMNLSEGVTLHSMYKEMMTHSKEKGDIIYHNGRETHRMTYLELYDDVKRIADKLVMLQDSHKIIGYLCETNLALPAVLLGILEASSTFAVIDKQDAKAYLENMKRYISIETILVEENFLQLAKLTLDKCWVVADEVTVAKIRIKIFKHQQQRCGCHSLKDFKVISNLAYVIQTSGTTGLPKVVQVPHQCIVPNIIHLRSIYSLTSKDRILLASSLTFDPSIIDIFLAVCSGASLVIIPKHMLCMPKILSEIILKFEITVLQVTPSLLQTFEKRFLQERLLSADSKLRILALGGERCPSAEKLKLIKHPENKTVFYNLYGLTEVSCWAMYNTIKFDTEYIDPDTALGIPLLDTDIVVRDESDCIVTKGYGQLFIGGSKRWCLINDEQQYASGKMTRPTGDWVHLTENGEIFFEGRKDGMIKHNGKKFSICSVDRILDKMDKIKSHFVFFHQDQRLLYVFVVCDSDNQSSEEMLQAYVHQKLKDIRCPPFKIVLVPHIPVTSHGKADHHKILQFAKLALKRKCDSSFSVESLRTMVSKLWKDFTKRNHIEDTDNFVLCGGDSISALEFASEVQQKTSLLCPTLVNALLNASFITVIENLEAEFVKFSNPSKRTLISSHVKDEYQSIDHSSTSLELKASDEVSLFSSTSNDICYRRSRRGHSDLCLCINCWCYHSLKCFETQKEVKAFNVREHCKFDLKKCVDASPCLVHFFHSDLLVCYIGSHSGIFSAMNVEQGTVIWEKQLPGRIESSACLSSCAQYVLVGCYDHNFYCFNALSGESHWTLKVQAEVKSSPVVSPKNVAFVGCHDHQLYAVDVQVGTLLWNQKIGQGSIFSSPEIFSDMVFAATLDGVLAALDQTSGKVLWKYQYEKPFFSSPVVHKNSIFIGCVDGFVLRFDLNGNLVLKYGTKGPVFSSVSVSASTMRFKKQIMNKEEYIVFGSHDGHIYCFSHDGSKLWSYQCHSPVYATPTFFLANDLHLYIIGACVKGNIVILDAENGNEICSFQCPGEIFSIPEIFYDYLIIGCRDNYVYVFKLL